MMIISSHICLEMFFIFSFCRRFISFLYLILVCKLWSPIFLGAVTHDGRSSLIRLGMIPDELIFCSSLTIRDFYDILELAIMDSIYALSRNKILIY